MTAAAEQLRYDDLYARWERGNWRATELDFSEDVEQWKRLGEFERRAALWNYALFFHGEDVVATDLAPFISAAPLEEQRYFLATQQADEARHAVFFDRFMREVAGVGGDGTIRGTLEAVRPQLTWGFVRTFELLDRVTAELRSRPTRTTLARAVVMYHFVVEATLAQPGQHFIQSYLEKRDLLPGFREGMRLVSLDEQRHIGFGVRLLYDLQREDPDGVREAVADQLREVVPYSAPLFYPPGGDRRYTECFGFSLEDIYEEGARSLEQKMRAAGLPLDELPGPEIMPMDMAPRERGKRAIDLVEAGILGDGRLPKRRDAPAQELLFDLIRRAVDQRRTPGRELLLQWDFADADPWHVRVDNGSTAAVAGRADTPDVTLRCRWDDWVDVIGGRADPLRLMARGRLRPKGSLRSMALLPRLFPRR